MANNARLKLDTVSGFKWDTQYRRMYLLDRFNIKAEVATDWESCLGFGGRIRRRLMREASRHFNADRYLYQTEQGCLDKPDIINLKVNGRVYMEGYWQSERYFADVKDTIRGDLQIVADMDSVTLDESREILSKNAVCIGIRRFQEESESVRKRLLDVEYYNLAIEKMNSMVRDPHYFVITEEPQWARDNLRIDEPVTFVSHKAGNENAHKNMWLMTLCKHFIVSQGTYHWWGAWLADNSKKIVMAPNPNVLGMAQDYIPDNWIKIG